MSIFVPNKPPARIPNVRDDFRSHDIPNVVEVDLEILKRVQQHDGDYNDRESANAPDNVDGVEPKPLAEQDAARQQHETRKEHVIDRRDDARVEQIQRAVQVGHLRADADDEAGGESDGERYREVLRVFPHDPRSDDYSERLAGHDGEAADRGADEDVPDDGFVAVLRAEVEDDGEGEGDYEGHVEEERR